MKCHGKPMLKSTEDNFPGFIYNCQTCDHEILITGDRRKPVSEQMQDQIDKLTENFGKRKDDFKEILA